MNMVIRMLQKQAEVYDAEGYGNELGALLNPASSYHAFQPDITFLIMDLAELLEHDYDPQTAKERIGSWFQTLEGCLPEHGVFYVSDAYLWAVELAVLADPERKQQLESLWSMELQKLAVKHANVRIFPYRRIIEHQGEEKAFSLKMWYMGKVLLGMETQSLLAEKILQQAELEERTPKKVLVLDLDNTLWGGLAGETDHTPVLLSEDHSGLAYKNLQRLIKLMQEQGVLLAIASKNNEEDAMEILEHHPHMLLGPEDFAARRINWDPKPDNIRKMAEELNLGTDSCIAFGIARSLGRPVLYKMFPGKMIEKYLTWTELKGRFLKLFALAIFLPVAPDDFLCYLAGTTNMTWKQFVTVIFLGKPFSIALYSLGLTTLFQVIFHLV